MQEHSTCRAVFFDYGTVSFDGDLDPQPLEAVLPALRRFEDTPEDEIDDRLQGCQIALSNTVKFDRARLERHPDLRLIALTATGTNKVDLEAARERGVGVCNIRDYCTTSVTQHVFAGLLSLTHRIREYDRALKAGAWDGVVPLPALGPIRELRGLTFGIVGFGTLGRAVASTAEAFGMHVVIAARPKAAADASRLPLPDLLRRVDVLSLHCPITPDTHHLIGANELALMKRDAILINTARGALVDAAALASALRAGRLGGAFIDVLEEEPPRGGNPLLAPDLPNIIVAPHLAWGAREARQRALDEVAANVADFLRGGKRNRVV